MSTPSRMRYNKVRGQTTDRSGLFKLSDRNREARLRFETGLKVHCCPRCLASPFKTDEEYKKHYKTKHLNLGLGCLKQSASAPTENAPGTTNPGTQRH